MRIADRLGTMDAAFVQTSRSDERQIAPGMLLELATACRRSKRTRLSYRDLGGKATVRDVDPYRLVDPPDPALLVSQGLSKGVYAHYMTIRLPLPMDRALQLVPPAIGTHQPEGPDATINEIGGPDADSLARYLLGLGVPLQMLSPDDVRQALLRRTRALFEGNGGSQS